MRILLIMLVSCFSISAFADTPQDEAYEYYLKAKTALQEQEFDDARDYIEDAIEEYSKEGTIIINVEVVMVPRKVGNIMKFVREEKGGERVEYKPSKLLTLVQQAEDEQKKQEYLTSKKMKGKREAPPKLVVTSLEVKEREPLDDSIHFGEPGVLTFSVENLGASTAEDVTVTIKSENKISLFEREVKIGDLLFGETVTKKVEFSSLPRTKNALVDIELLITEKDGFGETELETSRKIYAYQEPEIDVNDLKGHMIIGESSDILININNIGAGSLRNAKAEVVLKPSFSKLKDNVRIIDDLKSGDTYPVLFSGIKPLKETSNSKNIGFVRITAANDFSKEIPINYSIYSEQSAYEKDLFHPERFYFQRGKQRQDTLVVLIGNKNYKNKNIKALPYASNDVHIMKKVYSLSLGIPESMIIVKEDLTYTDMRDLLLGMKGKYLSDLEVRVKSNPDIKNVHVYYVGHGMPDDTLNAYLLPINFKGNPATLEYAAINQKELYKSLENLPVDNVFVFLDSCFSGEKIFVAQNRALSSFSFVDGENAYQEAMTDKSKLSIFAATDGSQFSWSIGQAKHGIFTYSLAHGLSGKADTDNNKRLEYRELRSYLANQVPHIADKAIQQNQIPNFVLDRENELKKVTIYE